jgi:hypothetical protein
MGMMRQGSTVVDKGLGSLQAGWDSVIVFATWSVSCFQVFTPVTSYKHIKCRMQIALNYFKVGKSVLLLGHAHSQPSMLCCHVGKT